MHGLGYLTGRESGDDVGAFLRAGEGIEMHEFAQGVSGDVEDAQDAGAGVCAADVRGDFQQSGGRILVVGVCGFAYEVRTQYDSFAAGGGRCELVEEGQVVLSWGVGEVNWTTGDGAGCGVETGPGVGGLEHVPVGEDVEVLG